MGFVRPEHVEQVRRGPTLVLLWVRTVQVRTTAIERAFLQQIGSFLDYLQYGHLKINFEVPIRNAEELFFPTVWAYLDLAHNPPSVYPTYLFPAIHAVNGGIFSDQKGHLTPKI